MFHWYIYVYVNGIHVYRVLISSQVLFLYFGGLLLKDASEKGEGPSEELQEVEEELIEKKTESDAVSESDVDVDVEKGHISSDYASAGLNMNLLMSNPVKFITMLLVSLNLAEVKNMEVFAQAFTLTFLAEWGDRSQIATIALASAKNAYGVILGGLIGHAFCTGVAVIGGRLLAARISERTVAIIGGVSFLGFGIHALYTGP